MLDGPHAMELHVCVYSNQTQFVQLQVANLPGRPRRGSCNHSTRWGDSCSVCCAHVWLCGW